MYAYISPEKVLTALRWLKQNNPLYADIDINQEWLEQAKANDEYLCGSLVQQNDASVMCSDANNMNSESTHQPNIEDSIDNGSSRSNQLEDEYGTQSMECCPSSLSSGNDALTVAFNVLERAAREKGFAIHDVPYDGDCLFSSIAYQLESIAACRIDKNTLREMLVDHPESNSNLYKRFEVSMVGANMLLEIHKRLQQIKGMSDDVTFGGVSILAVGDLYQLPPVA